MKKFNDAYIEYVNENIFDKLFGRKKTNSDEDKKSNGPLGLFGWLFGTGDDEEDKIQTAMKKLAENKEKEIAKQMNDLKKAKESAFIEKMNAKQGAALNQMKLKNQAKINNYNAVKDACKRQSEFWKGNTSIYTAEELASSLKDLDEQYNAAAGVGDDEDVNEKISRLMMATCVDKDGNFRNIEDIKKLMDSADSDDPNIKELKELRKKHAEDINKAIENGSFSDIVQKTIAHQSKIDAVKNSKEENEKLKKEYEEKQKLIKEYEEKKELDDKNNKKFTEAEKNYNELKKDDSDGWKGTGLKLNSDGKIVATKGSIKTIIEKAYNQANEDADGENKGDEVNKILKDKLKTYGIELSDESIDSITLTLQGGNNNFSLDNIKGLDNDSIDSIINDVNTYANNEVEEIRKKYEDTKTAKEASQQELNDEKYKDVSKISPEDKAKIEQNIELATKNIDETDKIIKEYNNNLEAIKIRSEECKKMSDNKRSELDSELQKHIKQYDDLSPGELFNEDGKRGYYDDKGEFHERPKGKDSEETNKLVDKYLEDAKSNLMLKKDSDLNDIVSVTKQDDGKYTVKINGKEMTDVSAEEAAKYEAARRSVKSTWKTEIKKQRGEVLDAIKNSDNMDELKEKAKENPGLQKLIDAIENDDTDVIDKYKESFKREGEYGKDLDIIQQIKDKKTEEPQGDEPQGDEDDDSDVDNDINVDDEDEDEIADKEKELEKKKKEKDKKYDRWEELEGKEESELSDEEKDEKERLYDEIDEISKEIDDLDKEIKDLKKEDDDTEEENDNDEETGKPKRRIKKLPSKRKGFYKYIVYDSNGKLKKTDDGKPMRASKQDWIANKKAWAKYRKNKSNNNENLSLSGFIKNKLILR